MEDGTQNARWRRIQEVFEQVADLPASRREEALERECGVDAELRRQVEHLLAHDDPGSDALHEAVERAAALYSEEEQTQKAASESSRPGAARRSATDPWSPGREVAGRYRLEATLGRGGMGVVYRALDTTLDQRVALKALPEGSLKDRGRRELLLREVRVAREITHPHVVRIFDVDQAEGRWFLTMELVDGEDLARSLRRLGPPSVSRGLEIARDLCAGLAAAHERGVLHRDLKPANVLVDGEGRARIADLGLAAPSRSVTQEEIRQGTPAYMAPEQMRGEDVSETSDLFSLGLVLYELFTGERPFPPLDASRPVDEVFATSPTPPSTRTPGLPAPIDRLVLQALDPRPARRPRSAATMEEVVREVLEGRSWAPREGALVPGRKHWEVISRMDRGRFGDVWLARHRETGEPRVFKFCLDAAELPSFEREVAIARLLRAELGARGDIARILDWQLDRSPAFLELEVTEAGDLLRWTSSRGGIDRVDLALRLELVAQIADAVAAIHSVGVVHGDLRAANVLVVDRTDRISARLTDFGLGAHLGPEHPRQAETPVAATLRNDTSSSGHPLATAPEVREGHPPTRPSDVYALGVLLYQMVVGDLGRALAPGWGDDLDDELLREDVRAAVEREPERRLRAEELATRLRGLVARREQRRQEAERSEEAERMRAQLLLSDRRRKWWALGLAGALALVAVFAVQERRAVQATQRAVMEAERADGEARLAREATSFVVSLFEVADPYAGLGARATPRQILDEGVRRAAEELEDQPQLRSEVEVAIGRVFYRLGLSIDARPLLSRAIDEMRERGPELELGRTLLVFSEVERQLEHLDAAWEAQQEAEELIERLGTSEDRIRARRARAWILRSLQRYPEAEAANQEALAMVRDLEPPKPLEVANVLSDLSQLWRQTDDLAAAESAAFEALEIRRRAYPGVHPAVASSLHRLAQVLQALDRLDESASYLREAVEMKRQIYPDGSPTLASSVNNLGFLELLRGDLAAAESLLRENLELRRRVHPAGHPAIATGEKNLGTALYFRGRLEEARPHLESALAIRAAHSGDDHPRTLIYRAALARFLLDTGDLTRSVALAESVLGHADDEGRRSSLARAVVAGHELRRGRPDVAEPGLRSALDAIEASGEFSGSLEWSFVASLLAELYRATDRSAAASELLSGRPLATFLADLPSRATTPPSPPPTSRP